MHHRRRAKASVTVLESAVSSEVGQEFRELVRGHTEIVALISESIRLTPKRGGREFVGLCPFHDDHDPSFHVYPDRQTYRCWSCTAGGDCFAFIMNTEKVGFREALEILARRAHLEIPRFLRRDSISTSDRAQVLLALQWAEGLFQRELKSSPHAEACREYFLSRGFDQRTLEAYRAGYHPEEWEWLLQQGREQFSPEILESARLVGRKEGQAGYRDYFVGRGMFPIRNERGQVVSFSGRILPGARYADGPKYWNGPESSVFKKGATLFGLDVARPGIEKRKETLVVEGYTDCMALFQAGITHVVGTMGTAMTEQQVALLRRFAPRVILIYDGDTAGIQAAERAIERLLPQEIDLRIVALPDGLDPADFLNQRGVEAFIRQVDSAEEAWDFKRKLLEERIGLKSVDARHRIVDEMLRLLAQVPQRLGVLREGLLIAQLSERVGIAESTLRDRYRELRRQPGSRSASRTARPTTPVVAGAGQQPVMDSSAASHSSLQAEIERLFKNQLVREERHERDLLEALFSHPSGMRWALDDLEPQLFEHRGLRQLWAEIRAIPHIPEDRPVIETVLSHLEDSQLLRLAVWLDDSARIKELERKVQDQGVEDSGCPRYVRHLLNNLCLLRERRQHSGLSSELTNDQVSSMNERAEELLKRLEDFHKRRASGGLDPPNDAA